MGVQEEAEPLIVDGLALMKAFLKIDNAADRRKVIELAAALVRGNALERGKPKKP